MHGKLLEAMKSGYDHRWFSRTILRNMRDRVAEEHWFNAQVMQESARWVEQNLDAERMFLTVECFDPHEPWFVPEHYRRRYDPTDGQETVISPYAEVPDLPEQLVRRTRGNYAGLVEMVDRWFGHLVETLRTTGVLDDALVIVTSDHGHGLWERGGWIGKRGYPSDRETYEVPMLVRHPARLGAGTTCDAFVQHHDITATILDAAGITPPEPIDGQSFYRTAFAGAPAARDHVTIGWGSAVTVIDDHWWFNSKVDGRGAFLHDSPRPEVGGGQRRGTASGGRAAAVRDCDGRREGGHPRLPDAVDEILRRCDRLQSFRRARAPGITARGRVPVSDHLTAGRQASHQEAE